LKKIKKLLIKDQSFGYLFTQTRFNFVKKPPKKSRIGSFTVYSFYCYAFVKRG